MLSLYLHAFSPEFLSKIARITLPPSLFHSCFLLYIHYRLLLPMTWYGGRQKWKAGGLHKWIGAHTTRKLINSVYSEGYYILFILRREKTTNTIRIFKINYMLPCKKTMHQDQRSLQSLAQLQMYISKYSNLGKSLCTSMSYSLWFKRRN